MSNYEYWIYQQLEPEDILPHTHGETKRKATIFAKWEMEDQERARLGDEEYLRREQEWRDWENHQKENNDI